MKKATPVGPFTEVLRGLVKEVTGGNQTEFAKKIAKCSQSKMSKILSGQQKPSEEIVRNIARHEDVDGDELMALWHSNSGPRALTVPIASSLLAKSPRLSHKLILNQQVEVPPSFYSQSTYAIRAHRVNGFRPDTIEDDDLLFLETSVKEFKKSLHYLDGKLAAFKFIGDESAVWLAQLSITRVDGKFAIHATHNASGSSDTDTSRQLVGGRELRRIILRPTSGKGEKTMYANNKLPDHRDQKKTGQKEETIQFNQIVGVVTLMMRGV